MPRQKLSEFGIAVIEACTREEQLLMPDYKRAMKEWKIGDARSPELQKLQVQLLTLGMFKKIPYGGEMGVLEEKYHLHLQKFSDKKTGQDLYFEHLIPAVTSGLIKMQFKL
jgi:hypothetical protein